MTSSGPSQIFTDRGQGSKPHERYLYIALKDKHRLIIECTKFTLCCQNNCKLLIGWHADTHFQCNCRWLKKKKNSDYSCWKREGAVYLFEQSGTKWKWKSTLKTQNFLFISPNKYCGPTYCQVKFYNPDSSEAQERKINIPVINFIEFPLCASGIKVTRRLFALKTGD